MTSITAAVSSDIEDIIKKRIINNEFNDNTSTQNIIAKSKGKFTIAILLIIHQPYPILIEIENVSVVRNTLGLGDVSTYIRFP